MGRRAKSGQQHPRSYTQERAQHLMTAGRVNDCGFSRQFTATIIKMSTSNAMIIIVVEMTIFD